LAFINSVLGPVNTTDLGFTLMHEHILSAPPPLFREYPELMGEAPLARAVAELKQIREAGIKTIMDDTTPDLGRDVSFLAEVAQRSGINILCCTGWWLTVPTVFGTLTVDQLASLFVRDIEQGIAGTGIRPAVLKAAADTHCPSFVFARAGGTSTNCHTKRGGREPWKNKI
jgi:phosphotriesterase-related protein